MLLQVVALAGDVGGDGEHFFNGGVLHADALGDGGMRDLALGNVHARLEAGKLLERADPGFLGGLSVRGGQLTDKAVATDPRPAR